LHRVAGRPFPLLVIRDVPDQVRGNSLGVGPALINEFGVPETMQIARLESSRGDAFVVAAPIMVVRTVQRLMDIADEVKQEFERRDLLFEISGRVCEFRGKFLDFINNAIVRGAVRGCDASWDGGMIEARFVNVGSGDFHVDEVPLPRPQSRAAGVGVSKLVRPGRR
jgi:hypothetical protein